MGIVNQPFSQTPVQQSRYSLCSPKFLATRLQHPDLKKIQTGDLGATVPHIKIVYLLRTKKCASFGLINLSTAGSRFYWLLFILISLIWLLFCTASSFLTLFKRISTFFFLLNMNFRVCPTKMENLIYIWITLCNIQI